VATFPQISYGAGPTVFTLTRGPKDFKCWWAPVVHDNAATSGAARERVVESMPIMISFDMPAHVLGDDAETWASFVAFALPGGQFQFYPCADLADYYNCVLESQTWEPARAGVRRYTASYVLRILLDGQAPADPVVVLRRLHGLT